MFQQRAFQGASVLLPWSHSAPGLRGPHVLPQGGCYRQLLARLAFISMRAGEFHRTDMKEARAGGSVKQEEGLGKRECQALVHKPGTPEKPEDLSLTHRLPDPASTLHSAKKPQNVKSSIYYEVFS